ncbi:unnamed protein product [Amoebophrya sp. A25]|nr:unnamed protein product [Amoebophrya sp. A25]|eukprot:GSA25T00006079001.1
MSLMSNATVALSALQCSLDEECLCGATTAGYCGFKKPADPTITDFLMVVVLVMLSGLFSGLTLGLLGLDLSGLEVVINGDDPQQAEYAKKIYPVRKQGNLLLCTLLLGNVMVNAALAIFMGNMAGGFVGFLVSTAVIVIFGEIVPQSACSRYALVVGAYTIPIVYVIGLILFPVSFPIAKLLDILLGEEIATTYSRAELMYMLKLQVQSAQLTGLEEDLLQGALSFRTKKVTEIMTPLDDVFMLPFTAVLDYDTVALVWKAGHSRVPVYKKNRSDVVAILLVKDLILVDPADKVPLAEFLMLFARSYLRFSEEHTCGFALGLFSGGVGHLGFVFAEQPEQAQGTERKILGVFSLEDVLEEILGYEIRDEKDREIEKVTADTLPGLLKARLGGAAVLGLEDTRLIGDKVADFSQLDVENDKPNDANRQHTTTRPKLHQMFTKEFLQVALDELQEGDDQPKRKQVSTAALTSVEPNPPRGTSATSALGSLVVSKTPGWVEQGGLLDPMALRMLNKGLGTSPLTAPEISFLTAHLRENYPGPELMFSNKLPRGGSALNTNTNMTSSRMSNHDVTGSPNTPWRFQNRPTGEGWISQKALHWLLATAATVEVRKRSVSTAAVPQDQNDWLLQAGQESKAEVIVVLSGVIRMMYCSMMVPEGVDGAFGNGGNFAAQYNVFPSLEQECGPYTVLGIESVSVTIERHRAPPSAATKLNELRQFSPSKKISTQSKTLLVAAPTRISKNQEQEALLFLPDNEDGEIAPTENEDRGRTTAAASPSRLPCSKRKDFTYEYDQNEATTRGGRGRSYDQGMRTNRGRSLSNSKVRDAAKKSRVAFNFSAISDEARRSGSIAQRPGDSVPVAVNAAGAVLDEDFPERASTSPQPSSAQLNKMTTAAATLSVDEGLLNVYQSTNVWRPHISAWLASDEVCFVRIPAAAYARAIALDAADAVPLLDAEFAHSLDVLHRARRLRSRLLTKMSAASTSAGQQHTSGSIGIGPRGAASSQGSSQQLPHGLAVDNFRPAIKRPGNPVNRAASPVNSKENIPRIGAGLMSGEPDTSTTFVSGLTAPSHARHRPRAAAGEGEASSMDIETGTTSNEAPLREEDVRVDMKEAKSQSPPIDSGRGTARASLYAKLMKPPGKTMHTSLDGTWTVVNEQNKK